MKLFGFNIERNKLVEPVKQPAPQALPATPIQDSLNIKDAPINIRQVDPNNSKSVASIPTVRNPAFTYMSLKGFGRGLFEPSEYELSQIGRIEDTEAYVNQAFKKKIGLMFKEGYDFVGKDLKTIKYVKTRLAQLAKASGIPTNELMRIIGSGIIKKSNTFLVKVRKASASGGRVYTNADNKTLQPIAAYFVIPAETMNVDSDEFGRIRKWRQWMPGRHLYQHWNPGDIVHFYFNKKDGFVFGTPTLIPVIDDIRTLRKIEENIELLVYQHLFPLFHYKVGTETAPAGVTEDGLREIDVVKQMIAYIPSEGGIVTPERHEIKMIGSEGRALRAEGYLTHFKKRVFAGLGVSSVDFGDGDTTNRATADNMSRSLIDDVKDFQACIETQFDEFIIKELLQESTFGDDVLDEEHMVHLRFFEIDIDKRIKLEAHAADQFAKHAITWAEFRQMQGREPVLHPDDDRYVDDISQYPEWLDTAWKLFEEPKALIQAIDEPYSVASLAAAANKNTSVTQEHVETSGEETTAAEVKKIKARPAARNVGLKRKKDSIRDSVILPVTTEPERNFLTDLYEQLEGNLIDNANGNMRFDITYLNQIILAQAARMSDRVMAKTISSFISGYNSTGSGLYAQTLSLYRSESTDRVNKYVNRLAKSLADALKRNIDNDVPNARIPVIRSVFSSLGYRINLISDVEVRKAYNYGRLLGFRNAGHSAIIYQGHEANCDRCKNAHNVIRNIYTMDLEDVPPFHGSCSCTISLPKSEEETP